MRLFQLLPAFIIAVAATAYLPHATPLDGPYVLCEGKNIYVHYLLNNHGTATLKTDTFNIDDRKRVMLTVPTDIAGQNFSFPLKKELENEKTEFRHAKKQFVVSDIEGNFKAFRSILQAHNIIDSNYNWTFGEGHLVLTGDFVDRGEQVTEVLWLIYSLEEKAKEAGGHVHFILGNHEIMNMSNDLRYLHPKYQESAKALGEEFVNLVGKKSEIGQWLRTKNIMEIVGNILYVHAGVSANVNMLELSTTKINKMVRPFYSNTNSDEIDPKTEVLISDEGPFWYRGYYVGEKAPVSQIDSTLDYYKVKHIATGHTVIAKTISSLHDGKVFNTDLHHAGGHTEALLIDDGKFYRATLAGEKIQIH